MRPCESLANLRARYLDGQHRGGQAAARPAVDNDGGGPAGGRDLGGARSLKQGGGQSCGRAIDLLNALRVAGAAGQMALLLARDPAAPTRPSMPRTAAATCRELLNDQADFSTCLRSFRTEPGPSQDLAGARGKGALPLRNFP
jgi:hypothetical protein